MRLLIILMFILTLCSCSDERADKLKHFRNIAPMRKIHTSEISNNSIFDMLPYSKEDKDRLKNLKTNNEIIIAVIDTGIDCSNPLFRERIWVPENLRATHPCGVSLGDMNTANTHDFVGHGTAVASLLVSLHPSIKIFPMKAYLNKKHSEEAYLKSLHFLTMLNGKIKVINYSTEGNYYSDGEYRLLKKLGVQSITMVNSAGNRGQSISSYNIYPAKLNKYLNNLIVVGGVERTQYLPNNFSNSDTDLVDISTVSKHLVSDLSQGITIDEGTSFSSPIVAGILALAIDQDPQFSDTRKSKNLLVSSALKYNRFIPDTSRFNAANGELSIVGVFDLIDTLKKHTQDRNLASKETYTPIK